MLAKFRFAAVLTMVLAVPAYAQFQGPSVSGREVTVEQARNMRIGSYITLTGQVIEHLRGDYFTFRDQTGNIRVEIPANTFRGQQVSPATNVRIMGEIDRGFGGRYIWVKTLDVTQK